ncbi:peptidoglycan-binding domain-containing protein [Streptomyces sp. NPDC001833]|uniref:peptidoglycan-binding domain-containing protein n=1 Tax=Streptomyces sp. NPDC001833 TaxID=3154658 RepID=UPI00331F40C4
MKLRMKFVALAATFLAFGGLAVSTTPASAGTGSGYVSGSGDWSDDWYDEGPISTSSYAHSNAAAMWQAILWADGYLTSTSKIDCVFGSGTRTATVNWQHDYGIGADGIVGSDTLTTAGTHGELEGPIDSTGYLTMTYYGNKPGSGATGRYVTFTRNTDGNWGMYIGSDHHLLSYTYANFTNCA